VDQAQAGVAEGHAGQIFGDGHLLPGNDVFAVPVGIVEEIEDQDDRPQGLTVSQIISFPAGIGLDRVGEGVKSGGGGEFWGHAHHNFRVIHGDLRDHPFIGNVDLMVFSGFGDHEDPGHLRGGPGGGIDGHMRDQGIRADFALEEYDLGGFGRIVGAPPAQGDERITTGVEKCFQHLLGDFEGGVGFNRGTDLGVDPGGAEMIADCRGQA